MVITLSSKTILFVSVDGHYLLTCVSFGDEICPFQLLLLINTVNAFHSN